MKHIVRYLLEADGSIPRFIEDGGYFPVDEELIGVSVDDKKRHLPHTVKKLSRADLVARVGSVERAGAFLNQVGLPDYE